MPTRSFLIILLCCTGAVTEAQVLSLDELIYLRGKDADGANTYLSRRGWVFHDASAETEGQYAISTWAFGKRMYSDRAKSFFKLQTADGYFNVASYSTVSPTTSEAIKAKMRAYKMVKAFSTTKDGYLTTMYMGANYLVETTLSTDDLTSIPVYGFRVAKKPLNYTPSVAAYLSSPAQSQLASSEDGSQEEEEATEETSAEASESSLMEVLQGYQIQHYKDLITSTQMPEPPASDVSFLAEPAMGACDLIPDVATPTTVYRRINPGEHVKVLSRLPDEEHEYYLVYSGGYYGYIERSRLQLVAQ